MKWEVPALLAVVRVQSLQLSGHTAKLRTGAGESKKIDPNVEITQHFKFKPASPVDAPMDETCKKDMDMCGSGSFMYEIPGVASGYACQPYLKFGEDCGAFGEDLEDLTAALPEGADAPPIPPMMRACDPHTDDNGVALYCHLAEKKADKVSMTDLLHFGSVATCQKCCVPDGKCEKEGKMEICGGHHGPDGTDLGPDHDDWSDKDNGIVGEGPKTPTFVQSKRRRSAKHAPALAPCASGTPIEMVTVDPASKMCVKVAATDKASATVDKTVTATALAQAAPAVAAGGVTVAAPPIASKGVTLKPATQTGTATASATATVTVEHCVTAKEAAEHFGVDEKDPVEKAFLPEIEKEVGQWMVEKATGKAEEGAKEKATTEAKQEAGKKAAEKAGAEAKAASKAAGKAAEKAATPQPMSPEEMLAAKKAAEAKAVAAQKMAAQQPLPTKKPKSNPAPPKPVPKVP